MKPLAAAAVGSALVTAVAAWALRSTDAAVAVAAVAAVLVLVGWLVSFHSDEQGSGLALAGPAHLVALALVGRSSPGAALPVVAAQVVGAFAAGGAALALDAGGGTLVWDEPTLAVTGALGVVVGLLVAVSVLAADSGALPWLGAGPLASGALLGVGLTAAAHPAAALGLALAGLVSWPGALVAAVAVVVGSAVGAFVVSWVSPHDA